MGVEQDHIIAIALDDIANIKYRDAIKLYNYVKDHIKDEKTYYIFLDEIQMMNWIFL